MEKHHVSLSMFLYIDRAGFGQFSPLVVQASNLSLDTRSVHLVEGGGLKVHFYLQLILQDLVKERKTSIHNSYFFKTQEDFKTLNICTENSLGFTSNIFTNMQVEKS